tara:strand:+ start:648 stop:944 length:297 start_codon:yes stop_codon:yes gene_type:complete
MEQKKADKFIMLHIAEESCKDFLVDAIDNQNVERGLFLRSNVGIKLSEEFRRVADRGYFPVGIVLDNSFNMEILFKRHPKQTTDMKMVELKIEKPYLV